MTASREHRNLGHVEDSVANVGTSIAVLESTYKLVAAALPDDTPALTEKIAELREAQRDLQDLLGM